MASTRISDAQLEQMLPERIKLSWTFMMLTLYFKIDNTYTEIYESKKNIRLV